MLKYVAFVWNRDNAAAQEQVRCAKERLWDTASGWHVSLEQPGLTVCCFTDRALDGGTVRMDSQAGVILGSLFDKAASSGEAPGSKIVELDSKRTLAVVDSGGRSLIDSCWGSYVLILRGRAARGVRILRGPVSALPCFYIQLRGLTIFFSSIDDCLALRLNRLTINWDCIRAQSVGGDYLTRETGIKEISTLLCGECVEVCEAGLSHYTYWNPASLPTESYVDNYHDAAELLRTSTQQCIDAWLGGHRTVLLELSGGLDSSILLACMNRAPNKPEVISVNFYSRGSGDERKFARSMTDKVGTELVEIQNDANVDLRTFLRCARTANPVLNFSAYDVEPKLIQLARERGATAIFTGEVGDDIFGHAPSPEVLAECLGYYGFRPPLLLAAIDYAELTRVSLWRALRQAIRYQNWQKRMGYWSFYLYRNWLGFSNERYLVSDDVALSYEKTLLRFIHPWFQDVRHMPPGRAMLIYALIMATSTWSHSPFGGSDGSLFMSPLASQPLVEAFARIPSRMHFMDGENGAVARQAFRSALSSLVLDRGTGKGTPELWIRDLIEHNRGFLRELFFDGVLVRQNILDRRKLEAMLAGGVSKIHVGVAEFVRQLYIEAWLRRWMDTESSTVA